MFYGYPPLDNFLKDLARLYGYTKLPEEPIDIFDDPRLSLERVMTTFDIRKNLFDRPFFSWGVQSSLASGTFSLSGHWSY